MTFSRKGLVTLVLLASISGVAATLTWQAIRSTRVMRLTVNEPAEWEDLSGTLMFEVTRSGCWRTDRYEYLWFDGQTGLLSRWDDLVNLRRRWMTVVLRLSWRQKGVSGDRPRLHRSPDDVDGFVAYFPGHGGLGWRVAGGEIVTDYWGDGITASADLSLERSSYHPDDLSSEERRHGASLRVSKHALPIDVATAFHCFNPNSIKLARELRYWLAEDPGLEDLLPARTLSWALDRATDGPVQDLDDPGARSAAP